MADEIIQSFLDRHNQIPDEPGFGPTDFNGLSLDGRLPWSPMGLAMQGPGLMIQGGKEASSVIGDDVFRAISTGDALAGLRDGTYRTILGMLSFMGVQAVPDPLQEGPQATDPETGRRVSPPDVPIEQLQQELSERNKEGTVTRSVLFGGTPYIMGGIAAASGVAAGGGGLLALLGTGAAVDALIASTIEDPKQTNLANLVVMLGEANPDHQFWQHMTPVFEYLATDPEDSQAVNRLRNGAVESLTNIFGEAVFGIAHLTKLKKSFDDGSLKRLGKDAMENTRGLAEAADGLLRNNPELATHIYGRNMTNISSDLVVANGARRFSEDIGHLHRHVANARRRISRGAAEEGMD